MASTMPTSTNSLVLHKSPIDAKPGKVYHDAKVEVRPVEPLKPNEVLVKIGAAAFNHRDLWMRKGMYPGITFGTVMGADGAGTGIASGQANDPLLNQRVFLVPMRGWQSHPDAPENPLGMGMLGGGKLSPCGSFSEYVAAERDQIIESPSHLDDVEVAAWPLAGVTAWRAAMVNARVKEGDNILITGIGGGVALVALQLCVAKGANIYVTSGDQAKIDKAIQLGAKGEVIYKDAKWPDALGKLLARDTAKFLDAVIDSGGGNIVRATSRYLKLGGRFVLYGMTAVQQVSMTMAEVMKNQAIIGSTMGSVKDLREATEFLAEKKITPVISHLLDGLESTEEGFELMQKGGQFGKIVIRMKEPEGATAKL